VLSSGENGASMRIPGHEQASYSPSGEKKNKNFLEKIGVFIFSFPIKYEIIRFFFFYFPTCEEEEREGKKPSKLTRPMWTGPPIEASRVALPGLRRPGLRLVKEN